MYAVVGCGRCSALWVVEGWPETTQCPRCRKRHRFERLKKFVETEDPERAREARASMLADREDAAADLNFSRLARDAEEAGVDDAEYLEASGVNADAVEAAGDRAEGRVGGSRSRREVVVDALRALDRPTEEEVVEHVRGGGISPEYVRKALRKLEARGEITERDGHYRLL